MEAVNKNIINVQEVEPRLRHQTIFEMYERLSDGESLIIHNNHDPLPVYYQMSDLFGKTFSWDYLEQGPEWWDVQVTKLESPKQSTSQIYEGEHVIDVPSITNHQLKHQTIFQAFDYLKPGESFIIHNDHDPKPVFYQLQGMHGDVFTWEYLEQGPQWWDIRVTLNDVENSSESIGEIVAKDIYKAEVFKKYGIDFCCNGYKTLRQACKEMGIDPTEVERDLEKVVPGSVSGAAHNFDEWELGFLADYVVNTHHKYVKKYMPEIAKYSDKVARVHGSNHPELLEINELVIQIGEEFFKHMEMEESELFPMVKEIVKAKESNTSFMHKGGGSFKNAVNVAEEEHDSVGYAFREIRRLSNNYILPSDACASYSLLFKMLEDMENDTFTHIHLENNIMFTKAIEIESNLI